MLTNVFSAVAGIVAEPVKGAKAGGFRGGAKGLGRGMLGLVCKPVKGTIDLVTHTTRGFTNTPKTMYLGLQKYVKKVPKGEEGTSGATGDTMRIDPEDDIYLGEEDGQSIYISRKVLKDSISKGQVLSALAYESERVFDPANQRKMEAIIERQRARLT